MSAYLGFLPRDVYLVAFHPGGGVRDAQWCGDHRSAARWANMQNAIGYDVFFSPHMIRPGCRGAPTKADIVVARYCVVDIEHPLEDGEVRQQQLSRTPPAVKIWSGSVWHLLWEVTDASPAQCEQINRRIALGLGGTFTRHDVTRLLRVPGTLNSRTSQKAFLHDAFYSTAELLERFPD